ncbi:hypothetical protein JZ751_014105 [Albula glossodonta]|uniref:Uncharacterized protein n=1 Tax=Albula glossodonta TaxID=121402 RepID=A0A8T2NQJ2_9TELE|nr:hypothetical protein JZ751_014105 [Albula glossodonta]
MQEFERSSRTPPRWKPRGNRRTQNILEVSRNIELSNSVSEGEDGEVSGFKIKVPLQAGQPLKFTVLETLDRNKEEFEFLQAQYHRQASHYRFLMQSDQHPHTG